MSDQSTMILAGAERRQKMEAMRRDGMTLQQIGAAFGVSRERVRQVLANSEIPKNIRAQKANERLKAKRLRVLPAMVEYVRTHPGASLTDVADALGEPRDLIAGAASARLTALCGRNVTWVPLKWSDEDILEILRTAAGESPLLTSARYEELLRTGAIDGPSSVRIVQRFQTWNAACEAAGLETFTPVRTYSRGWDDQTMVDLVVDFIRDGDGSYAAFGAYASKREGAPSSQTVRNRLGDWATVRGLALAVLAGDVTYWKMVQAEAVAEIESKDD